MTMKINKAEFIWGKEAGEILAKLEQVTGKNWCIKCESEPVYEIVS